MAKQRLRSAKSHDAFDANIVDRLRAVLESETSDIQSGRRVDYEAHNAKKAQGLLEISRLLQSLDAPSERLIESLRLLEAAIHENRKALSLHLAAACAINSLISSVVRESQSDGTYCADGIPHQVA